ncbi:hypothetical protein NPIL_163081 [Nephila pilipes]|uniref:Uncharacterized protein n=1 Tax=Nephila pilipes TaxID=299642 RepID=A0A8X6K565_NEPPI|nr:hypothetical protein NPIL_163081 [Nephila pilipes]
MISSLKQIARSAELRFKPTKYVALYFNHTRVRSILNQDFSPVSLILIRYLRDQKAYKYLGVKVDFPFSQNNSDIFYGVAKGINIRSKNLLSPWGKLKTLRVCLIPRIDFIC